MRNTNMDTKWPQKQDNRIFLRPWCLSKKCREDSNPSKYKIFAEELLEGVELYKDALDKIISSFATAWPVEQLPMVDRNILRVALFELKNHVQTPRKTVITEAVELGKMFGSDSSGKFINGVLGSIVSDIGMRELVPDGT